MQKFSYTAVNIDKKKFKGTFLAEDENELKASLLQQNLYLVKAKPMSDKPPNAFFSVTGKLSIKELTSFCRQFCAMINSGISIVDSLEVLSTQKFSKFFQRVLLSVYEDVKAGVYLSEAMKKHKMVFPNFFVSMVYVGEASGSLDQVLENLADYYDKESEIKRKVKGALIYPVIMIILIFVVLAIMMLFVVPTFQSSLASLEVEMPAITMAIFNASNFLKAYWQIILISLIVVGFLIFIFFKTETGKVFMDKMKISIPVIKTININLTAARFARGFGLLLSSGMDLIEAMETIEKVLGNRCIQEKFKNATESVRNGQSLTMSLENEKIFPTILTQMVSVGEKTAKIDEILNRSCSFFDEQVDTSLSAFTTVLQPILLVFMGAVIALMFIAVYSPMLSIMQNLI